MFLTFLSALFVALAVVTADDTSGCPANIRDKPDVRVHGDKCYHFELYSDVTYSSASGSCEFNNGHLVMIKSKDVQDFIYDKLENDFQFTDNNGRVWIGLDDYTSDNDYHWSDGSSFTVGVDFSYWAGGQGPHGSSDDNVYDDCVMMDVTAYGRWYDVSCKNWADQTHGIQYGPYICEYPNSGSSNPVTSSPGHVTSAPSGPSGAIQLAVCSNHADGICLNMNTHTCPSGWHFSYSGCGFMEKCCFPNAPTDGHPTDSPGSPGGSSTYHEQCGVPSIPNGLKIVGGSQTTIEAHPWQISLRYHNSHICGGSLIADRWVLTAAHCVDDVRQIRDITVLVGETNKKVYSQSNVHSVDNILVHQGYGNQRGHDIALIKLHRAVDLSSDKTRTICVPDDGDDFAGDVCVASGWGYMRENSHTVDVLRHVSLPIVSQSLCDFYMHGVHDKVICAGRTEGGVDTCQGDSGGPLICQSSDGSWKQAGIVSTGVGCARPRKFGFYTKVSSFKAWIDNAMATH